MQDVKKVEQAIILAAGLGSRLKPLTDTVPKCLTEVNGKPILLQTLELLEKNGIKETVIVIGYLGQKIADKFGNKYGNMKLTYIWNHVYAKTNTMFSVWLARDYLKHGVILIEGDIVFGKSFMQKLIETDSEKSYWMLDSFGPKSEGSMSVSNDVGRIIIVKIVRTKLKCYCNNFYKSTGVLKLTPEYGKAFSNWLTQAVSLLDVNIYYDLVLEKHLKDLPLYVGSVVGIEWMEIDIVEDLKRAEEIFVWKRCSYA